MIHVPICEVRKSLLWNDYYIGGIHVGRKILSKIVYDKFKGFFRRRFCSLSIPIVRHLTRNWGDHCPYCDHLILISKWEKAFPDIELKTERIKNEHQ